MSDEAFETDIMSSLITRLQAGDQRALDELIRRSAGRLMLLARKLLRNFPAARTLIDEEDVLQSGLIRLMSALSELKPSSTSEFFGLATTLMRRELIDICRRVAARPDLRLQVPQSVNEEGRSWVQDLPEADEDTAVGALDKWSAFHEAVERLPTMEREVLSLIYYHGWTQGEIAQLFGCDERTIRRRWQSAGKKLRELLGDELPELE